MDAADDFAFDVPGAGAVSALLLRPADAKCLLVLAHGAGAGMSHPFLGALANELAARRVATLRYQFPYMQERRRVPDSPAVLTAAVAAAVRTAATSAPGLPLFAGGKSMGGRMSSQAAAQDLLPDVRGLAFFGFPLHPPNRPGTQRAEHLAQVKIPMLFLQGTRDNFADLKLLQPVVNKLGSRATLQLFENADHSFHLPKSAGRSGMEVLRELAQRTSAWAERLLR
jgi:predicted alpha/beta-hydrolase family hydrolase